MVMDVAIHHACPVRAKQWHQETLARSLCSNCSDYSADPNIACVAEANVAESVKSHKTMEIEVMRDCPPSCGFCGNAGGEKYSVQQGASNEVQTQLIKVSKKIKIDNNMTTDELERRDLVSFGCTPTEIIGEGHYSRVYTGFLKPYASVLFDKPHLKTFIAKEFVVKAMSKDLAALSYNTNKEAAVRIITNELSITMGSQGHPNIVRLLAHHETLTHVYMFLERCREDLFMYVCRRGRLKEEEARNIYRQFLSGVLHLHGRGIVHRDLKCENVLLDFDHNVKITDFGLAAIAPNKRSLWKTGCGSLSYAAPELLMDQRYDGKLVDTWAAGVVLFLMINGAMPFGTHRRETLLADMRMQRLSFTTLCSPECRLLIRGILQWDPVKRLRLGCALKHIWILGQKIKQINKKKEKTSKRTLRTVSTCISPRNKTSSVLMESSTLHSEQSLARQSGRNTSYSTVSFQQGRSSIRLKSRVPDHTKKRYLSGVDSPEYARQSVLDALESNRLLPPADTTEPTDASTPTQPADLPQLQAPPDQDDNDRISDDDDGNESTSADTTISECSFLSSPAITPMLPEPSSPDARKSVPLTSRGPFLLTPYSSLQLRQKSSMELYTHSLPHVRATYTSTPPPPANNNTTKLEPLPGPQTTKVPLTGNSPLPLLPFQTPLPKLPTRTKSEETAGEKQLPEILSPEKGKSSPELRYRLGTGSNDEKAGEKNLPPGTKSVVKSDTDLRCKSVMCSNTSTKPIEANYPTCSFSTSDVSVSEQQQQQQHQQRSQSIAIKSNEKIDPHNQFPVSGSTDVIDANQLLSCGSPELSDTDQLCLSMMVKHNELIYVNKLPQSSLSDTSEADARSQSITYHQPMSVKIVDKLPLSFASDQNFPGQQRQNYDDKTGMTASLGDLQVVTDPASSDYDSDDDDSDIELTGRGDIKATGVAKNRASVKKTKGQGYKMKDQEVQVCRYDIRKEIRRANEEQENGVTAQKALEKLKTLVANKHKEREVEKEDEEKAVVLREDKETTEEPQEQKQITFEMVKVEADPAKSVSEESFSESPTQSPRASFSQHPRRLALHGSMATKSHTSQEKIINVRARFLRKDGTLSKSPSYAKTILSDSHRSCKKQLRCGRKVYFNTSDLHLSLNSDRVVSTTTATDPKLPNIKRSQARTGTWTQKKFSMVLPAQRLGSPRSLRTHWSMQQLRQAPAKRNKRQSNLPKLTKSTNMTIPAVKVSRQHHMASTPTPRCTPTVLRKHMLTGTQLTPAKRFNILRSKHLQQQDQQEGDEEEDEEATMVSKYIQEEYGSPRHRSNSPRSASSNLRRLGIPRAESGQSSRWRSPSGRDSSLRHLEILRSSMRNRETGTPSSIKTPVFKSPGLRSSGYRAPALKGSSSVPLAIDGYYEYSFMPCTSTPSIEWHPNPEDLSGSPVPLLVLSQDSVDRAGGKGKRGREG